MEEILLEEIWKKEIERKWKKFFYKLNFDMSNFIFFKLTLEILTSMNPIYATDVKKFRQLLHSSGFQYHFSLSFPTLRVSRCPFLLVSRATWAAPCLVTTKMLKDLSNTQPIS